jgi:hypothetical protein
MNGLLNMLKRRRRTTVFKVEQLEGRVVPSAMAAKAVIIGDSSTTLNLSGYTTLPNAPGEHLELRAIELLPRLRHFVVGRITTVVVKPASHPGHSGSFSATIHVEDPLESFHAGGEVDLTAGLLSGRIVVDYYLSRVKVTRD